MRKKNKIFYFILLIVLALIFGGCTNLRVQELPFKEDLRADMSPKNLENEKKLLNKKPKIAVVLSGGGIMGISQAGALYYLVNVLKLEIDLIVGTSVGALNGTMIAQGDAELMKSIWFGLNNLDDIFRTGIFSQLIALPKGGLYSTEPLADLINRVDLKKLRNSNTLLWVAAVNLNTGKLEFFNQFSENFKRCVLASCSIPVANPPVIIKNQDNDQDEDQYYVDGGLREGISVQKVIKETDAKIIIAILATNINEASIPISKEDALRFDRGDFRSIIDIAKRATGIAAHQNVAREIKIALELVKNTQKELHIIQPGLGATYGIYDMGQKNQGMIEKLFWNGYEQAGKAMRGVNFK